MISRCLCSLVVVLCASLLCSCGPHKNFAPVTDVSGYETIPSDGKYRVAAGDTLYSIAWRYGVDYRQLASKNSIDAPYSLQAGEVLYIRGDKPVSVNHQIADANSGVNKEPEYQISRWQWPTRGKVVSGFSNKNNGIKIRGFYGDSVYAAAPGKVVYAGSGLRGYGNLVIIKHNSQYLSAYALNKELYVKEGEWVSGGQKIAQVGMDVANRPSLHFEIRKAGDPVNPLKLLKS